MAETLHGAPDTAATPSTPFSSHAKPALANPAVCVIREVRPRLNDASAAAGRGWEAAA